MENRGVRRGREEEEDAEEPSAKRIHEEEEEEEEEQEEEEVKLQAVLVEDSDLLFQPFSPIPLQRDVMALRLLHRLRSRRQENAEEVVCHLLRAGDPHSTLQIFARLVKDAFGVREASSKISHALIDNSWQSFVWASTMYSYGLLEWFQSNSFSLDEDDLIWRPHTHRFASRAVQCRVWEALKVMHRYRLPMELRERILIHATAEHWWQGLDPRPRIDSHEESEALLSWNRRILQAVLRNWMGIMSGHPRFASELVEDKDSLAAIIDMFIECEPFGGQANECLEHVRSILVDPRGDDPVVRLPRIIEEAHRLLPFNDLIAVFAVMGGMHNPVPPANGDGEAAPVPPPDLPIPMININCHVQ